MAVPLETERLRLRNWTLDDVEAAFAIYGDPEVMHFMRAPEASLETQRESLERILARYEELGDDCGFWAMEERATGEIVGTIILKPLPGHEEIEIGWHLARRAWGKGYATEGARACLEFGFGTVGLSRIVAVVAPDNFKSQVVAFRLGMKHQGRVQAYERELEFFVLEQQHPLSISPLITGER